MAELIDWDLAASTGARFAPSGPALSRDETFAAVEALRSCAQRAVEPVASVTGMHAPASAVTMVVDRPAWIASNVSGLRLAMSGLIEKADVSEAPAVVRGIGSRTTGIQVGAVLAWLSTKVLGQYEAFTPDGEPGRLLLVAPTIVQVEQQLDVVPADFRLWVCLHEETHRVQFGAVPWLSGYLASLIDEFADATDLAPRQVLSRILAAVNAVVRPAAGSIVEAMQSPEQREVFGRITALMSLLEGHADVVMDEVGPQVVPTVTTIRERFSERRSSPTAIDAVARRALGMDVKLRQYSEGAAFVRAVVDRVGMEGFNAVWQSPASLPTREEIADPSSWVSRIHG